VPPGYDGREPVPVVLMIHGAGGTARWTLAETGWGAKADQEGFLAVFPQGTPPDPRRPAHFRTNPQLWNDGPARDIAGRQETDDVGFIRALLTDLAARFAVDEHRVYVTGFSNGAAMTFRLGAELSTAFAAL